MVCGGFSHNQAVLPVLLALLFAQNTAAGMEHALLHRNAANVLERLLMHVLVSALLFYSRHSFYDNFLHGGFQILAVAVTRDGFFDCCAQEATLDYDLAHPPRSRLQCLREQQRAGPAIKGAKSSGEAELDPARWFVVFAAPDSVFKRCVSQRF